MHPQYNAAIASSVGRPRKIPAGHPYANYAEHTLNKKLKKAAAAEEEEEKKKREEAFYNYHNVV
jgi:hypothetical protein